MVNVLLLEDDEHMREYLRLLLIEVTGITHIFAASNALEAIAWAKTNRPQLIVIDIVIDKDGPNGIEVAKTIRKFDANVYIIFVSGYPDYALESFEVHPYSYILKPIAVNKFKFLIAEIVNKVQYDQRICSQILAVKIKDELVHINKSEIIFVEASNHKSIIHTRFSVWEPRISLDQLEMILGDGFLRVHRSFVVNLSKIKKIRINLDRSYEIDFHDYPQKALMSRYHYPQYRQYFQF